MRILPFVMLLALVGCDDSEQEAMLRKTSKQVEQWIPMGTSLAVARQTMEQHQFRCSVASYDSVEQMKLVRPEEIGIWKESVIRDHVMQDVTNVTDLECKKERLWVNLRLVNGETMGIVSAEK
jgi:hypothetical protein